MYFNDFSMSSDLDAVASTFSLRGLFDPANPEHLELFKPLSFPKIEFFDDDNNLFFTGTIVGNTFRGGATPQLTTLRGYSSGGVLEDCTIPYEAYPLESSNRSLTEITQRLLGFFKLNLVVYPNVKSACSIIYEKSVASPSDSVKGYIAKLAAQRNVILSHDKNGNVILFRPDAKAKPVAWFDESNICGEPELDVNGQDIHSSITSVRQPGKRNIAEDTSLNAVDTITDNLVKAYRPYVHILSAGTETDTTDGAKNAFANELKNIKVKFDLDHWENLAPGDIIMFKYTDMYVGVKARLMVMNVLRGENSEGTNMTITAVLPETFTGEQPVDIFHPPLNLPR